MDNKKKPTIEELERILNEPNFAEIDPDIAFNVVFVAVGSGGRGQSGFLDLPADVLAQDANTVNLWGAPNEQQQRDYLLVPSHITLLSLPSSMSMCRC